MVNNQNDNFSAYQAYPPVVRPFLLQLENHPLFQKNFTHWSRRVAIDILARIRINDASVPILLRMNHVARAIGVCTKTVQRVVNYLKELGWIKQEGDGRDDMGNFSFRKFIVSKEVREIMGLPTDFVDNSIENNKLSTKNKKMSNGVYGVNKDLYLKEASLEKEGKTKPSAQKGVRSDLIEIIEALGLHQFGLFKLLALCKKAGIRLQAVWELKKETILKAKITGGRAFNYLMKLIFSWDVVKKVSMWKEKIFPKDKVLKTDDNRRFWYKRFAGPNGLIVKIFDGIAEVMTVRGKPRTIPAKDMPPIYEDIKLGHLKEIIL